MSPMHVTLKAGVKEALCDVFFEDLSTKKWLKTSRCLVFLDFGRVNKMLSGHDNWAMAHVQVFVIDF